MFKKQILVYTFMNKEYNINDLYALKFQATEEGLEIRDFIRKLQIHEISLDEAIENTKKGISTREYLKSRRRKRNAMNFLKYGTFPVVGGMILVASYLHEPSKEEMSRRYEFQEYYRNNWREFQLVYGH